MLLRDPTPNVPSSVALGVTSPPLSQVRKLEDVSAPDPLPFSPPPTFSDDMLRGLRILRTPSRFFEAVMAAREPASVLELPRHPDFHPA